MSEPKPATRQVVVLREGPPKKRGMAVDIAFGILGIALLVLAVALVDVLPDEEVPPKQYLATYPTNATEMPIFKGSDGGQFSFIEREPISEGTSNDYRIPVDRDNVYQFSVTFGVAGPNPTADAVTADDIPSSLPDRFAIELLSPNGTVVGSMEVVTGAPYYVPPNATILTPYYNTDPLSVPQPMPFAPVPSDEFLTFNSSKATKADALRVLQDQFLPTKGDWTLRVTMVNAGDCPSAGTSLDSIRRNAECLQATENSGQDPGNNYSIQKVTAFYYDVVVRDPDDPDDLGPE